MAYQKHFKLLFCALGIFVCYFYFGILQEKITRRQYGDGKDCEKFTYMFSLVFIQCLINYLFAKTSLLTIMKQGEDSTPKMYYVLCALTYLLAMVCSNMALQFVSYPTQVIAKSAKPVPVMILGVLLGKKVYPVRKYLFVLLVVFGVVLFMYKDVTPAVKKYSEGQTAFGEFLLLLSLIMDGLLSAVQERMRAEHNSKSGHMMLNINGWSAVYSGSVILASREIFDFIQFLHRYPSTIWHIINFCIAGAFGQYFIFLTVAEFGPLPCSLITTTRKLFTVLGSIVIFGNNLIYRQWLDAFPIDSSNIIQARGRNYPLVKESVVKESTKKNVERWYFGFEKETEPKEEEECTNRSIYDFPTDLFSYQQRRHGAVVLHAFLGLYCFLLTAFVCHDYLLPAVDCICVNMHISTDVAGATFLAMASSFPELFVNIIGTFLTESDLGAGTVVGSAVFDTFATPACGALTTLYAIPLEWRILSRDCTMYVISVGTLVIIMWDDRIQWYEAMVLLILFCSYLILLFCGKIKKLCCGKIICSDSDSIPRLSNVGDKLSSNGSYNLRQQNNAVAVNFNENANMEKLERKPNGTRDPENVANSEKSMDRLVFEYLFTWPKERNIIGKCWFILGWPLKFLLFVTIPDIRVERLKHWYPLSFIMCIIWIAISSYLVSWMVTVVGDTIEIPDSIMGLTFLAAGGNMPEMASIVVLAKQGDGNMAMSNTLGANILDILLCLGLPWMIKCLMTGRDVQIVSGALSYSVLSTVVCIIVLYAVIACFKFKLNKKVGIICLLLYTIFLIFAILVELNIFFPVNLPMCD
ncbi:Sodium/potassium/calcium exchanger 4 [Eufriesea mexicana]|uniref:Sodium/potassium/calcium exchanger 4 n=1 Tax=Eufriesea mexicana TaxID=516756 RepID=A0A310S7P6_9HYME|nr:Sodium/potassium/calcium exchanger 4 [Eufriesea mexicana]